MYIFSKQSAEQDDVALWQLQCFLLTECESRLGSKASNIKIYQPTIDGDRPHLINEKSGGGAFACLSDSSKSYWPTTLYELAHETVHLLNPVAGFTNYLEEGFAVIFAEEMSKSQTNHPMVSTSGGIGDYYSKAAELVQRLPNPAYECGKEIRATFGSLGTVDNHQLRSLFPSLNEELSKSLTQECNFNDPIPT